MSLDLIDHFFGFLLGDRCCADSYISQRLRKHPTQTENDYWTKLTINLCSHDGFDAPFRRHFLRQVAPVAFGKHRGETSFHFLKNSAQRTLIGNIGNYALNLGFMDNLGAICFKGYRVANPACGIKSLPQAVDNPEFGYLYPH